jgi:Tfp pilus assembly protein PilF
MRRHLTVLLLLAAYAPIVRADSTPHWTEVRSDHFDVFTDAGEKQGRHVAGQFERMRSLFRAVLPHAGGDAELPITVLALKDRKGFTAVEPAAYLAKGSLPLAGLFLRTEDRNYILLRLDTEGEQPYTVVYHEYTHFVLRKEESLPLWLNEGLAEFYQNTVIGEKDVQLGQPSANDILYLRQNKLLPLPTLFAVDHNSPYYHEEQKGSVFYAESWALTHLLRITDFQNKANRIGEYARLVSQNTDPVAAAQQAFGDLNKHQKELDAYVSHGDYKQFLMKSTFTADEASFKAQPVPTSTAGAVRASVLASNDRVPEAKTLIDAVLRDDPKSSLAHEVMGLVAYREHDLPAARKWYGEAVDLNSDSYLAYLHYATLSMAEGSGNDEAIADDLQKAIKLGPSFAPAYDALAQFYASHHEKLDDAHMLTVQAVQLEPAEIRYRLNAAQVLVEQGSFLSAQSVLKAALDIATTPGDKAMVQSRIESLKNYQAMLAQNEAHARAIPERTDAGLPTAEAEPERVWPAPAPAAPHRTLRGTLHNTKCAYPTALTFSLEQPGKSTALFAPNYYKISFSTINFEPQGTLDPCKAIEGMKASVTYAEVIDKDLAGQVLLIALIK